MLLYRNSWRLLSTDLPNYTCSLTLIHFEIDTGNATIRPRKARNTTWLFYHVLGSSHGQDGLLDKIIEFVLVGMVGSVHGKECRPSGCIYTYFPMFFPQTHHMGRNRHLLMFCTKISVANKREDTT
jgi:hypothetical protein